MTDNIENLTVEDAETDALQTTDASDENESSGSQEAAKETKSCDIPEE